MISRLGHDFAAGRTHSHFSMTRTTTKRPKEKTLFLQIIIWTSCRLLLLRPACCLTQFKCVLQLNLMSPPPQLENVVCQLTFLVNYTTCPAAATQLVKSQETTCEAGVMSEGRRDNKPESGFTCCDRAATWCVRAASRRRRRLGMRINCSK
jgi:hypothetical protein